MHSGIQGIHYEKIKVALNEKRKKLRGFSYYKNIANFEAFWRNKNFSKNLLFLGCERFTSFFTITMYIQNMTSFEALINKF